WSPPTGSRSTPSCRPWTRPRRPQAPTRSMRPTSPSVSARERPDRSETDMPGLIRGVARTAVVAGTATAVSNRVSRRQAAGWADQDQQQYEHEQYVQQQQYAQQQQQYPPQGYPQQGYP